MHVLLRPLELSLAVIREKALSIACNCKQARYLVSRVRVVSYMSLAITTII